VKVWLLLVAAASLGAVALAPACDDPRSHIFVARVYNAQQNCVSGTEGIDIVQGDNPNGPACAPICIIDSFGDVGISGMCPPYPYGDVIEGLDGGFDDACTHALADYNCNVTCDAGDLPDGALPVTDAEPCLQVLEHPDGGPPLDPECVGAATFYCSDAGLLVDCNGGYGVPTGFTCTVKTGPESGAPVADTGTREASKD
jgi:hypothetical protein